MLTILDFKKLHKKVDPLDLDLIIAAAIKKPREFVLAHPEFSINSSQGTKINSLAKRRIKHEPLAYILGQKEFFGLNFTVNKHTLVPRPETELLIELAQSKVSSAISHQSSKKIIVDVGTGSGNIIISLAKKMQADRLPMTNYSFYGIDISKAALKVAKKNAATHKVDKKIKFLHGNLLEPLIDYSKNKKLQTKNHIILANLPYLSSKIYSKTSRNVKKYEPKSALLSRKEGLDHYEKLFKQIKFVISHQSSVIIFLEFSPEQKNKLTKLVKKYFPKAKPVFHRDLAGKWRVCEVKI